MPVLFYLFLLFTVVPLIELYFLIKIGGYLGALNTIVLILTAAFLGAVLVRWEGLRILHQISHTLAQGLVPAEEVVDGLLVFAAGVLLITPGVLTDFLALFLLFPFTRRLFKLWVRKRFARMISSGGTRISFHSGSGPSF